MDLVEFLEAARDGKLAVEFTDAIREAAFRATRTGKVAEVTLKFKIEPAGEETYLIDGAINSKLPEPSRPATVFFADDRMTGGLPFTRRDPRQPSLPLERVG